MRCLVTNGYRWSVAFAAGLILFATSALARPGAPPPAESSWRVHGLEHTHQRIQPDEREPEIAPEPLRQKHAPVTRSQALVACEPAAFASASGAALVSLVKGSTEACINSLFYVTAPQSGQIFIESKMATIANALTVSAQQYAGNNSAQTLQLILFLRAGYYVQFYQSGTVGSYGASLRDAIRPALAAFVANTHFTDVNDAHGVVLREFVILIDSAGETAQHLGTLRGLLDRFDATAQASYYMSSATNSVYQGLYRGHGNAGFLAAVQADPSILTSLESFITRTEHLLGTSNQYLTLNAARELARFLRHTGTLQTLTRPKVKAVIVSHSMTGPSAGLWVSSAEMVDFYDKANCAYYGTCDFRRTVEQAVLGVTHTCGATLRVRAQDLTATQLAQSCDQLATQEAYFHDTLKTNRVPVASDNNTSLEVIVFDSSIDYQNYAGVLFGISTNNGGMYLEGNPAASGNQARFISYEAEWLRPTFEIWNLRHEYIHYLDGRFNMKGDFNTSTSQPTVWWIEGLAEYISKKNDNASAVTQGRTHAFQLSEVLRNNYSSSTDRVYSWGYLATRFMFERHADQVGTFLEQFRTGNYATYRQSLDALGTANDAEFHQWIDCVARAADPSACVPPDSGPGPTPACTASNPQQLDNDCYRGPLASTGNPLYFYLYVPPGARNLRFVASGGTGNADLYVRAGTWPTQTAYDYRPSLPGNDETVEIPSPTTGGYYYLMLAASTPYSDVKLEARFERASLTSP
ncbi:M9 family metallopeptidase [Corallococcus aberystwythensis]|uniref:microbial collagenase n=1 Tax=Corallococcus aberystwythensis TaxID=2316722 RepID=A0A3A8Q7T0_9BACT|nr:M9 family metallopeptidase [Corallococcus aberystwythensis]RKH63050.1 collagenase [Corallococcus aberystwythensis]